jgi:hypothetical protein
VIEHLADDAAARAHFLSGSSANGVMLALSLAGGRDGERQLPLLATDADWDTLTDRVYVLVPELDAMELQAVLDSISRVIALLDRQSTVLEARALARTILSRTVKRWDETGSSIPLPALDAWLTLNDWLPPDPPRPAPPNVTRTWADLLPACESKLADRRSVERFADWLTLADLLRGHRPEDLSQLRFRDQLAIINKFLDDIEAAPDHKAASAGVALPRPPRAN